MKSEELAQRAVQLARRSGADQAEALVVQLREKAINVFNRETQLSGSSDVSHITVRLFKQNRGAVMTCQGSSERALEDVVERAVNATSQAAPDKFLGPVDEKHSGDAPGDLKIFDQRLADLSIQRLEEIALNAESSVAGKDNRISSLITSSFQVQDQTVSLCNSLGFKDSYRVTTASLITSAVMSDYYNETGTRSGQGDEAKLAGGAAIITHTMDGLDLEKAATRTIHQLNSMVGARPSPSGWFPIVFAPTAARRINSILLQTCSGPVAMLLKASSLGKIGDSICSPLITLVDDGSRAGGIRTAPFDHEGVRPRRKVIIEGGVFREYLLNSYYARALERDSTGNAVANEEARYSVRPSNAYIEPGTSSPDSLIADIKQGFYVTAFLSPAAQLTPVAANFVHAVAGFWIENGKLTHPVRAATISASLPDTFKSIVAVGNDLDTDGAVVSPTLMVSKMNVEPLL
jgi:PmbA protein